MFRQIQQTHRLHCIQMVQYRALMRADNIPRDRILAMLQMASKVDSRIGGHQTLNVLLQHSFVVEQTL